MDMTGLALSTYIVTGSRWILNHARISTNVFTNGLERNIE